MSARDESTRRTSVEEQLVIWDYYLDLAIAAAGRDPARGILMPEYDIAKHLTTLKDALKGPSTVEARALAECAVAAEVSRTRGTP